MPNTREFPWNFYCPKGFFQNFRKYPQVFFHESHSPFCETKTIYLVDLIRDMSKWDLSVKKGSRKVKVRVLTGRILIKYITLKLM